MVMLSLLTTALFASQLASAFPASASRAKLVARKEDLREEYDYVIVGGGTSGLTVGDRLSEGGKYSVLAIELGYLERDGYRPGRTTFNITSLPSPKLKDRSFNVGIGCIVGGSSAVNGQVFQRGTAGDYNMWGKLAGDADTTWSWKNILGYFKKGIHFTPPREDLAKAFNITYDLDNWGQDPDTKIYATYATGLSADTVTMYSAMRNFPGVDTPADGAGGQNGLVWFTTSMDPVTHNRSYARTGHWDDLDRENYELITATKVNKILFDDENRAVGVQIHPRDDKEHSSVVRARKEVILAAGAVHTPQILQLSGIGPAGLLEEAGIDVRVDLPGVGYNFQDHHYIPGLRYTWGKTPETPELDIEENEQSGFGIALGVFLGLKAVTPERYEEIASKLEKQDPAKYLPEDADATVIEGYKQQKTLYAEAMRTNAITFFQCMFSGSPNCSPQNMHPLSRGTILINTTDPEGEVIVDYRAASNPIDIDVMIEDIKFWRRFTTTGDLEEYEIEEDTPGPEIASDAELRTWARENIIPSVYHPIGTAAKMPRAWGGVVDEELRVYGVKGLSVVDASVMPTIVGTTTSMTVYAIAEKAADLIKDRARDC